MPGLTARRDRPLTNDRLRPGPVLTLALAASLVLVLMPASPGARVYGQAAYPEFTGERVYVGTDVPNRAAYLTLDERLAQVEEASAQTYYVVVERSVGGSTREYTDRLFDQWQEQSRERKLALDPARSVLIVVAIDDRRVSVRPGSELQSRFGLEGPAIDQQIVRPNFAPLARAGNYPEAILALVGGIEAWVADRDPDSGARREQAAERRSRARQDATDAIASATRQLDEARRELNEKRPTGLDLTATQAVVDRVAASIPELNARIDSNPMAVLSEAQRGQQELAAAVADLRRRSLQQVEAAITLDGLPAQLDNAAQRLDAARQAQLPVKGLQRRLDAAHAQVESARALTTTDPGQALDQARTVAARIESILNDVDRLPELQDQQKAAVAEVAPALEEAQTALQNAQRSGADVASLQESFDAFKTQVQTASQPDPENLAQAVTTLRSAVPGLQEIARQADSARASHRFYARTLPLILAAIAAAGAVLIFLLVKTLQNQARNAVENRIKTYREQATKMMERLDAVKERHRMLPVVDQDFQEPMGGATLELYQSVENRLRTLWDRWLQIMDRLEQAQKLRAQQSGLGVGKLKEAEELLSRAGTFEKNQQEEAELAASLDRLNHAHEQARAARDTAVAELKSVEAQLGTLEAAGIPVDPYHGDQQAIETELEQADSALVADPIGAALQVERVRARMTALLDRIAAVHTRFQAAQATRQAIDALKQTVADHRAGGLRLDEPDANPELLLHEAALAQAGAIESLQKGDPAAAASRLDAADAAVNRAQAVVTDVLAARDAGAGRLQNLRQALEALGQDLDQAQAAQAELQRDFAPASWKGVANHLDTARERLDQAARDLARVETLFQPDHQHYLLGARLLDHVEEIGAEARRLIDAVQANRDDLHKVRDECQAALGQLDAEAESVGALFRQSLTSLGGEPREALEAAQQAQQEAIDSAREQPADWLIVRQRIARARESYQIARERAEAELAYRRRVLESLKNLAQRADRLGRSLKAEEKDRPPANTRYRGAINTLAQLTAAAQRDDTADWAALARQVEDVAADLQRAEELASEDVQLANQAIAEIAGANRLLRQAHTYSSLGVSVDLDRAQAELKDAQRLLQNQQYEPAIERAGSAEYLARAAFREAQRAAQRRQERIEAERRRREATVTAHNRSPMSGIGPLIAGAAAAILMDALTRGASAHSESRRSSSGGGFSGGFGGSGGGGGSRGGSGTSESSWSSGTSESGW